MKLHIIMPILLFALLFSHSAVFASVVDEPALAPPELAAIFGDALDAGGVFVHTAVEYDGLPSGTRTLRPGSLLDIIVTIANKTAQNEAFQMSIAFYNDIELIALETATRTVEPGANGVFRFADIAVPQAATGAKIMVWDGASLFPYEMALTLEMLQNSNATSIEIVENQELQIAVYGRNLKNSIATIVFHADHLELIDVSMFTHTKDSLPNTKYTVPLADGEAIEIWLDYFDEIGVVYMQNQTKPERGKTLSGLVNIVKFRAIVTGETSVFVQ